MSPATRKTLVRKPVPASVPSDEMEVYTEAEGGEIVDLRGQPTALEAMTRGEIDVAIGTAKKYPRNLTQFLSRAKTIVAMDVELAELCSYSLPPRKEGADPIEGPSVRLAEILAACYGNLRIGGRIIADDGKFIKAQGVAHDLENNVVYAIDHQEGVTYSLKSRYSPGGRFGDDMIKTIAGKAVAIATRNATFKVIPMAFVRLVQAEAMRIARGDEKSLPERTGRAIGWFVKKGVAEDRIYATLGIGGAADMTIDLLQKLNGYRTAIVDGVARLGDLFPEPAEAAAGSESIPVPGEKRAARLARDIGGKPEAGRTPEGVPDPEA